MFSGDMVHVMENTEKIIDRFNNTILPEITGNSFDRVETRYKDWDANNCFDLFLDYPYGKEEKDWSMEVNRQPQVQDEHDYYRAVESALYNFTLKLIDDKRIEKRGKKNK